MAGKGFRRLGQLCFTAVLSLLTSVWARIRHSIHAPHIREDSAETRTLRLPSAPPLLRAHAHNDYQHPQPLYDALIQGFNSVEADVYYFGEELYVGHYPWQIRPAGTLSRLYLQPLMDVCLRNGGRVHRGSTHFYPVYRH